MLDLVQLIPGAGQLLLGVGSGRTARNQGSQKQNGDGGGRPSERARGADGSQQGLVPIEGFSFCQPPRLSSVPTGMGECKHPYAFGTPGGGLEPRPSRPYESGRSRSRAMIFRMISLVPSPISSTFESR